MIPHPRWLQRLRRHTRPDSHRWTFRPLFHERLEDRTLLTSATLSIVNGAPEYQASTGVALTVSVASSTYTFTDPEGITLGAGTSGWSITGDSAKGPSSTVTQSISIDTVNTSAGNDSVALMSVGTSAAPVPTYVAFSNDAGSADTVTLGGAPIGGTTSSPTGARRAFSEPSRSPTPPVRLR